MEHKKHRPYKVNPDGKTKAVRLAAGKLKRKAFTCEECKCRGYEEMEGLTAISSAGEMVEAEPTRAKYINEASNSADDSYMVKGNPR